MVVFILETVPIGLRGELSRWLLELKAGVFVGNVSSRVREELWKKVCQDSKGGPCIIAWTYPSEQGFKIEFWGGPTRVPTLWEGLQLLTKPTKS
jgi:CRISPR-associated protein Cas2